jgi:glyoxylase-like metal-dependent hydrolase (beta-lactamase superfamily II)
MKKITESIYYQSSYAGVTLGAIILPHGSLIIDSPLRPEEARSWKSNVLTKSRGTHRLLVNLDDHIDRTLGNRYIDLTIIAHNNAADRMENRSNIFKGQSSSTGSEWEKYPETVGIRWAYPIITFDKSLHLHWGDKQINIDHRPGPNEGAAWVEIPSDKVVFVGDAVLDNQPPFLAHADIPTWLETLSILMSRKYRDYTIISGRSGKVNREALKKQQAVFKSILGRMDTLARKNAPPEGTQKMIPALLKRWKFAKKNTQYFTQRLEYGLSRYFMRHYVPEDLEPEA